MAQFLGTINGNFDIGGNWVDLVVPSPGDSCQISANPTSGTCAGNLTTIDTGIALLGGVVSGSVNLTGDGTQVLNGMTADDESDTWFLSTFADMYTDPGCIISLANFVAVNHDAEAGIIDAGGNVFYAYGTGYYFFGGLFASELQGPASDLPDIDGRLTTHGSNLTGEISVPIFSTAGTQFNYGLANGLITDDGSGQFGAFTFANLTWGITQPVSFAAGVVITNLRNPGTVPNGLSPNVTINNLYSTGAIGCNIDTMIATGSTLTLDTCVITNPLQVDTGVKLTRIILTGGTTIPSLDFTAPAAADVKDSGTGVGYGLSGNPITGSVHISTRTSAA